VYPGQRTALTPARIADIRVSIQAVMSQVDALLTSDRLISSRRFMIFPLFLAGIESNSPSEKMWIATTLARMEELSIGPNVRMTNLLLREIYSHQHKSGPPQSPSSVAWPRAVDTAGSPINDRKDNQNELLNYRHYGVIDWVDFVRTRNCRFIIYDI
jgi:hypothetical protein